MRRVTGRRVFSGLFTSIRIFLLGLFCGFIVSSTMNNATNFENVEHSKSHMEAVERRESTWRRRQLIEKEAAEVSAVKDGGRYHRILCWVLTSSDSTLNAEMMQYTWGRKCDKLLFINSGTYLLFSAIDLTTEEIHDALWKKATQSVRYLHAHYLHEFDWFFRASDDTYAIVENLRRFLSPFNSSLPYFLGHDIKGQSATNRSGGAGYLLSREALRRVVELGLNGNRCRRNLSDVNEDVSMSRCVKEVGGIAADTNDDSGRQRFIAHQVSALFSDANEMKMIGSKGAELNVDYGCCSSEPILFHNVSDYHMQVYEYLLYKLKIAKGK